MRRGTFAAATLAALLAVAAPAAAQSLPQAGCDPLDPAVCLQPWPNDFFTRPDASTPTGKRLALPLLGMPRNAAGVPIRPDEYNRNDGFSPGSPIHTFVPGLDFGRTGLVPLTDMARAFDADQPAVVIDAATGERQLIWAEMDANAKTDAERNLYIRPGRNWEEGHRYIVALRFLRDAQGNELEAQPAFRAYRDKEPGTRKPVDPRREHMDELFKTLNQAGVKRKDLYLAWDFTVGSEQRITERMLGIRDDAFARLGDTDLADGLLQGSAPTYRVTQVIETPSDPQIIREVRGTFTVPCYLDKPACPTGSKFLYTDLDSNTPTPLPGNTAAPTFRCIVPRSAQDGPRRVSLYGHGLFGSQSEVTAGNVKTMAAEHGFVFCATDWWGMANQDVVTTLGILGDLSNFALLPDRVQQGMLNFLLLGRLMIHPQGLAADPAFQVAGHSAIDTSALFYDGNSQGGIIGGALTAVAPDFRRAVLGVPGMNYSTLLQRSVDFDQFAAFLYPAYPREIERPMIFSLIQQLWDRGEANGYAHHMTSDPLADTPAAHRAAAPGARRPPGRHGHGGGRGAHDRGRDPAGPARAGALVRRGSVLRDPADRRVPVRRLGARDVGQLRSRRRRRSTNTPNRAGPDPHGSPRKTPAAQLQKSEHLRIGGAVIDTCGGGPCHSLP